MTQTLILFNIGWMKRYEGVCPKDKIINGGKFVTVNGFGGEVKNFLPRRGYCYGYVQTRSGNINIEKIGCTSNASYVDGVTVVFTATPKRGGRRVVGWYQDARVWRNTQFRKHVDEWGFLVHASMKNCILLSEEERTLLVPNASQGEWGMGEYPVRYITENDENQQFVKRLRKFISNPVEPVLFKRTKKRSNLANQEKRIAVEKASVTLVTEYYEECGWECESVESENKGWDLEMSKNHATLLVEVKGSSGLDVNVQLTPNEYRAMLEHRDNNYRLAVVTNALRKPKLHIVSFNENNKTWWDQNDDQFIVEEKIGAKVSVK